MFARYPLQVFCLLASIIVFASATPTATPPPTVPSSDGTVERRLPAATVTGPPPTHTDMGRREVDNAGSVVSSVVGVGESILTDAKSGFKAVTSLVDSIGNGASPIFEMSTLVILTTVVLSTLLGTVMVTY